MRMVGDTCLDEILAAPGGRVNLPTVAWKTMEDAVGSPNGVLT
jgi:hypothetical protein